MIFVHYYEHHFVYSINWVEKRYKKTRGIQSVLFYRCHGMSKYNIALLVTGRCLYMLQHQRSKQCNWRWGTLNGGWAKGGCRKGSGSVCATMRGSAGPLCVGLTNAKWSETSLRVWEGTSNTISVWIWWDRLGSKLANFDHIFLFLILV